MLPKYQGWGEFFISDFFAGLFRFVLNWFLLYIKRGETMINLTFDLITQTKIGEHDLSILIDEGYKGKKGLARMFIPSYNETDEASTISLELYLNAEECEALGKHLLAVSERLRRDEKADS
jgi:hypothetical protein